MARRGILHRVIARDVPDPAAFAELVEPLVRRDPVGHSILAVSLGRLRRGEVPPPDVVWFVVESATGEVVAAGQHYRPFLVGLHGMREAVAEAAAGPVADLLLRLGREPVGAAGPRPAVLALARAWRDRTGEGSRVTRELGRWVLTELVVPTGVPGAARPAVAGDVPLVADWVAAFGREVHNDAVPERSWAEDQVRARSVHLWEVGGTPVAMACLSAPEGGVSRVGPVWTPAVLRGRGYGSAVTAAATSAALDAGASDVCLYTDLSNSVSNAIYARLGFVRVGDEVEARFGAAPG